MHSVYMSLKLLSEDKSILNEERRRVFQCMEFIKIMIQSNTINHDLLNEVMRMRFTK